MLDDLKSFFTTSSVAEVGVGVTIGAAFAGVVGAATDTGQSLLQGDLEYAGLLKALVALLSVALLSLFGVVKPLLALREKMTRVQAAKVLEAAQQARSGDLRGAVGTARDAGLPLPGGASDPDGTGTSEGAGDTGTADEQGLASATGAATATAGHLASDVPGGGGVEGLAADAESLDAVGTGTAGSAALPLAGDAPAAGTDEGSALTTEAYEQAGSTPAGSTPAAAPAGRPDPLTAPLSDLVPGVAAAGALAAAAAQPAGGIAVQPDGGIAVQPTSAAVAGPAGQPLPHGATDTKLCPYCAFDIPAVATRCGWCTSDLGDLERGPDPVVVQA